MTPLQRSILHDYQANMTTVNEAACIVYRACVYTTEFRWLAVITIGGSRHPNRSILRCRRILITSSQHHIEYTAAAHAYIHPLLCFRRRFNAASLTLQK